MNNSHHEQRVGSDSYALQAGEQPTKRQLLDELGDRLPKLRSGTNWKTFSRNVTQLQLQIILEGLRAPHVESIQEENSSGLPRT